MNAIKKAIRLNQTRMRLAAQIAAITRELDTITPKLEEGLALLGYTKAHDCSQAGSRRVIKANTVQEAIVEVLPIGKSQGIKAGEIFNRIKDGGLTYAKTTVNQALSKMEWDWSKDCGGYGQSGKVRKAHTYGQGNPSVFWRLP